MRRLSFTMILCFCLGTLCLTTSFAQGVGGSREIVGTTTGELRHRGYMFDVVAGTDLTLCTLEVALSPDRHGLTLWTKPGTHVGHEQSAASWTQLGTAPNFRPWFIGTLENIIPIPLDIFMTSGERRAFFVTSDIPFALLQGPGSEFASSVHFSNPDLDLLLGTGTGAPFAPGAIANRSCGVRFSYEVGTTPCPALPIGFERNDFEAEALIGPDIAEGPGTNGIAPAVVEEGFSRPVILSLFNGFPGMPSEVLVSAGVSVATGLGGVTTPGGQHVNIDLATTPFISLLTGNPSITPIPFASSAVGFNLGTVPATATVQMLSLVPSALDGFLLSQAAQLNVRPDDLNGAADPIANLANPQSLGDDDAVELALGFGFVFHGRTYTSIWLGSNGLVSFEDPSATIGSQRTRASTLNAGPPAIIGLGADLNPNQGGQVSFETNGTDRFAVAYTSVPLFGSSATVDLSIVVDQANQKITINYGNNINPREAIVAVASGRRGGLPFAKRPVNHSMVGPGATSGTITDALTFFETFNDGSSGPTRPFDLSGKKLCFSLDISGFVVERQ